VNIVRTEQRDVANQGPSIGTHADHVIGSRTRVSNCNNAARCVWRKK
jgi:hypothetical protein